MKKLFFNVMKRCLKFVLRNNIKRLLVLGSLMGMLNYSCRWNKRLVEKVNKSLQISTVTSAINFPIQIKNVIWSDSFKNGEIDTGERKYSFLDLLNMDYSDLSQCDGVDKIAETIPSWLIYAEIGVIREDITSLISSIHRHQ